MTKPIDKDRMRELGQVEEEARAALDKAQAKRDRKAAVRVAKR